ncbi:MAG: nucleotidyltransferase domain-containing protein [bacterium]
MTKAELNEAVFRILKTSSPDKIILFGSCVGGNYKEGSDIDFLIIKQDIKSKIMEYAKIRKGLKGLKFPFDIIILTPQEYDFYSENWKNSVVAEAKEKGMVLYGK